MAQYDGSIRINTEINSRNASAQMMSLESRIAKTSDKIASLRSKMDSLKNVKIPTQEYKSIESDIAKAETELEKLIEKQSQMQREGKDSGAAWDKINQRIQASRDYIELARGEMQQLVDTGRAFSLGQDTQEYASLSQQLGYAENDLSTLTQRHNELIARQNSVKSGYQKIGKTVKNVFSAAINIIKKTAFAFSFFGKSIKKAASFMTGFGKSAKSTSGSLNSGLKTMLKYGLGIRSLYALVNKFRAGVKTGFENLAQASTPVNKSISSLMSALTRLKNSLATAFAPILTAVAPALTSLINLASRAATAVGMLIAALTGQKTFIKATAVQEDYAASLDKTSKSAKNANKQLSGLDKLNNLTTSNSGKEGGDGGISPEDMFETVKIPSKFENLAKMIKEAWEKADFSEIGSLIGKKLKSGLESIPWSDVKKTAEKVGKSFATLINGFVEVPGLGTTIGKTIAKAINTGLSGLNAFSKNLKWEKVGKFFSDEINGFFRAFDFELAADAINNTANGILDAFISCVENVDWKEIRNKIKTFIQNLDFFGVSFRIGNLANALAGAFYTVVSDPGLFEEAGQKIADSINGFFEGMGEVNKKTGLTGWEELGQSLSNSITGILVTINTAFSTVKWENVGKAIAEFIGSIKWGEILLNTGKLIVNALWSAIKVAVSAFVTDPVGIVSSISTVMAGWFVLSKFLSVVSALKTAFSGVLQSALTGATNALKTGNIKGLLQSKLGKIGAIVISLTIAVESIKWASGKWSEIFKKYSLEEITGALNEMFSDLFGENFFSDALTGIFTGLGALFSGKYSFEEWINGFIELGGDLIDGLCKGIKAGVSGIGKWIKSNIFDPFVNGFKSLFGIHSPSTVMAEQGEFIISGLLNGLKNGITSVITWLGNIPAWFKEKFAQAYEFSKSAFSGIGSWFSGRFSDIKNAFSSVGTWFKGKFTSAYSGIKSVFSSMGSWFGKRWSDVKTVFSSVGSWFKEKFDSAYKKVTNAFSGVSGFFSDVWSNITGAFGNITKWFKDNFSDAWKAVKNVFSTGGKIFDGIKNGILNGLKTVINGIIGGINKIIEVPFNGLNSALKKLKSVSIAGLKPFDWMPTISVPQIPKLATGAVIPANKEFLAVLGDQKHGRNLEAPEDLIRKIVREETAKNNSGSGEITVHIPVEVDGKVLFELMKKIDREEYQRTGEPSFQM